ncbi:carbohydrate esterase family 8 protein [Gonapodya prolifera JEL478]|uniref:pectinesterase n=1 Tax=Gonapodya prolifera (strain JEL478) TaxID=1344416 RepID=A0A139A6B8_GONPJ|nr:carbohydrate esterase family 8 protein [Gonapodya prolifera JEL478]|eukprot:KXS12199.1 carbohydrate esterase family 8 protein [Gonapodya prolifera JEL478]
MPKFPILLALLLALPIATLGHSYNRVRCQSPTLDPLEGCPPGTLVVSQSNATGKNVFSSIQAAVASIANLTTPATILVLPGIYTEQVNVTRRAPITLLGQTLSPQSSCRNLVKVYWNNATAGITNSTFDNAYTSVLTVAPTLNASLTGKGPTGFAVPDGTPMGNEDFRAYNIDFENFYRPFTAGPSLALSVSYANASFYHCGFYSYQDTVYIGKIGNTYIYDSIIAGQTDFLYGFGTLWIQSSLLSLRGCGGGITAWKGTNTTFTNMYGVYIVDSEVRKANATLDIKGKCPLGRPWNAQHKSIFANTFFDDTVSGYIKWQDSDPRINNLTFMAVYGSYGPGADEAAWAQNVTKVLTEKEYAPYKSVDRVFKFPFSNKAGNTRWIDWSE